MWVFRGSTTMSFAPRSFAVKILQATSGWVAVVFEPTIRIVSAPSSSSTAFVMAPLPNAVARPATVEECQSRAQWSTLFVPMTARKSFWKR